MIGMDFGAFITLLVISAVLSAIFHGLNYKVLAGVEGYFAKLAVGWIGAWVGSPVLGYWGPKITAGDVFIFPAILGSVAAIFLCVATLRALSMTLRPLTASQAETETRRVA